ncbi:Uncharacterized protein APZ42_029443 [Daphnia magna]|uniref:Uncharacterized protein n=1 Tax=Daphnia magna TaxID=35525 RepID=A0A164PJI3_9CRUS|nr:Uncharacterized protein APZ42_029443 [Daphnia magna]
MVKLTMMLDDYGYRLRHVHLRRNQTHGRNRKFNRCHVDELAQLLTKRKRQNMSTEFLTSSQRVKVLWGLADTYGTCQPS